MKWVHTFRLAVNVLNLFKAHFFCPVSLSSN